MATTRDTDVARRLLRALAGGPGRLTMEGEAAVVIVGDGARRLTLDRAALGRIAAEGLVRLGADGRVAATPEGIAHLRRALAGADEAFAAQHRTAVRETRPAPDGTAAAVTVDAAESPLARLARRRGRDGRPLLEAEQVAAGDRLRADYTFACLVPRTTMDWSAFGGAGGGGRRGPGPAAAEISDAVIAARGRVERALAAVGPELAGVAVDVCCFLEGLEAVERRRGWPVRSGKVVLAIALDRLAAHYGIGGRAEGPAGRGIRHWGAADFRPRA